MVHHHHFFRLRWSILLGSKEHLVEQLVLNILYASYEGFLSHPTVHCLHWDHPFPKHIFRHHQLKRNETLKKDGNFQVGYANYIFICVDVDWNNRIRVVKLCSQIVWIYICSSAITMRSGISCRWLLSVLILR